MMVTPLKLLAEGVQGMGMKAIVIFPEYLFVNLLIIPRFDESKMRSTGLEVKPGIQVHK